MRQCQDELSGGRGMQRGGAFAVSQAISWARCFPKVNCQALADAKVEIRGDERAQALFPSAKPTSPEDWDTEYLALIVGVKVVDSVEQAIEHINEHGSHHTDAILTSDMRHAEQFTRNVDSASVMVNASTRFA